MPSLGPKPQIHGHFARLLGETNAGRGLLVSCIKAELRVYGIVALEANFLETRTHTHAAKDSPEAERTSTAIGCSMTGPISGCWNCFVSLKCTSCLVLLIENCKENKVR